MTQCTYCGAANIDGVDSCEHCREPFGESSLTHADADVEHCLLHDKVVLLLPRRPIMVPPTATVRSVLEMFVDRAIGCVLVTEAERLVGIFTERDVVIRIGAKIDQFGERPVGEFMTAGPETIAFDAEIAYALQRMDVGGYRHLPVMAGERIVGVISIRDILQYLARHLEVVAERAI